MPTPVMQATVDGHDFRLFVSSLSGYWKCANCGAMTTGGPHDGHGDYEPEPLPDRAPCHCGVVVVDEHDFRLVGDAENGYWACERCGASTPGGLHDGRGYYEPTPMPSRTPCPGNRAGLQWLKACQRGREDFVRGVTTCPYRSTAFREAWHAGQSYQHGQAQERAHRELTSC